MTDIGNNYIESAILEFRYYKTLGDKTFEQLNDEELFKVINDGTNSIAIIVKHLSGNMLSRWTDFLTTDGEKEWRDREGEFQADIKTRHELISKWEEGWSCLFNALKEICPEDFKKLVYVRNMGHTIPEAINRQIAHYAYHIGQIVFLAKALRGAEWIALSIPKGKSKDFNEKKFSSPKRRQHFSNDFIGGGKEDGAS